MPQTGLAVVMPVFNEAEGIAEFIHELDAHLASFHAVYFVVDDHSSDSTPEILKELVLRFGSKLQVIRNERNLGHGPSTVTALKLGVSAGREFVLSVDGDGQITGSDARRLVEAISSTNCEVAEGVRLMRREPMYRKVVSMLTKLLVWIRSGVLPRDANTPFRIYRNSVISHILESIDISGSTPNLKISEICRRNQLHIKQLEVVWRPRRASSSTGTMWGPRRTVLPSRKFVAFCLKAGFEWVKSR